MTYPPGGYDYPKSVSAEDTNYYFYPIKNLVPRRDTFLFADEHYFFQAFKEPNLSIKALGENIFRLTKVGGLIFPTVITITNKNMIIKRVTSGSPYPEHDISQLNKLELLHYHILEGYFPLEEGRYKIYKQAYVDSMINLYPQLLDPKYYRYLIDKITVQKPAIFNYTTKTIKITNAEFQSIVNQINSSGYWSLPFRTNCDSPPQDGYGYILEANTRSKYNIIVQTYCPPNSDTSPLFKVCNNLIKYADEK